MSSKLLMIMAKNNKGNDSGKSNVNIARVRVPPLQQLQLPSSLPTKCVKQLSGVNDCSTQLLMDNVANFKRSGVPARFMYYEDGSWIDFSAEAFADIRSGFVERKPMVEVQIGTVLYLFDFYRMLQIDLVTADQRSIAWIDVEGQCFFPKRFIDGGSEFSVSISDFAGQNQNPVAVETGNGNAADEEGSSSDYRQKIEILISIGENQNSSTKRKREGVDLELEDGTEGSCSNFDQGKRLKKLQQQHQKQIIVPPTVMKSPRFPHTKLLKEGDQAYEVVKNLFISSLDVNERGAMVTTIHQCVRTDPSDKARYQAFQKQLDITKAARGDANMQFAWYGTSAQGVSTILAQGFRSASKISGRQAHGIGVYLSSIKSSYTSEMLSDVDENGEKHVLLCRVILGRFEKVKAGSQQSSPSSMDFDTGVDDINNPKWHVVWCANMNTHIIPECVVSYRAPSHLPGRLNESPSSFKLMPDTSPAIFSAQSLSKLGNSLPPSKALQLQKLCNTYKERKVAKDMFVKQVRAVVGDDRLLSVIREYRPLV